MVKNTFFLKGDICWSSSPLSLKTAPNSFLLCWDGKSGGIYAEIPPQYTNLPVMDFTGKLIIPGLTDLHIHAPQFTFRAMGMDMELLEWLNKNTFPEEAKYRDLEYAREAYKEFIKHEKKGPNTRLCIYATTHVQGTLLLADMLEESGLVGYVGKVNMDRNCPDYIREDDSKAATLEWLDEYYKRREEGLYKNTMPILTPRFIPSCSDELLKSLSEIKRKYGLPVQSHLSENRKEIEWVRELCPKSENYAKAYADFGLMEGEKAVIMAHCVWSDEKELDLLAEKGVYIAHCPQSNINLSSGIAPARRFLEKGIHVGLGSDVAGGVHTSIFRAMTDAIQVSKLRQALIAPKEKSLTLEEAFYLGTAGGGSFFGDAGSFEEGWDFDAIIIDDSSLNAFANTPGRNKQAIDKEAGMCLHDRLERVVYLSDDSHIIKKYVRGNPVL